MTWPTVLAYLLVYLLGAILTAAFAAALDDVDADPDEKDVGFLGGFSLLWPVLVPLALVYGVVLCIGWSAFRLGRLIRRAVLLK